MDKYKPVKPRKYFVEVNKKKYKRHKKHKKSEENNGLLR